MWLFNIQYFIVLNASVFICTCTVLTACKALNPRYNTSSELTAFGIKHECHCLFEWEELRKKTCQLTSLVIFKFPLGPVRTKTKIWYLRLQKIWKFCNHQFFVFAILFALKDTEVFLLTDNFINLASRCRGMCVGVCFARSFRPNLWMKNATLKCFYGTLLPSAFHAEPVLATSTISY